MPQQPLSKNIVTMIVLVLAGEGVFMLPFVIARVFRPTILEVFAISNEDLGWCFSAYGVVAMLCYLPGGPLADRFSARRMMSLALWATGLGGAVLLMSPSLPQLRLLYAFWGLTTILLFWSGMLKATRELGGRKLQGTAFGILDGGRGLTGALLGTMAVVLFGAFLDTDPEAATAAEKYEAYRFSIGIVAALVVIIGLVVWTVLPKKGSSGERERQKFDWPKVLEIFKMPKVWLQAIIIVCAYVGYKATDDFSLYASEVLGMDDLEAAQLATIMLWIRPPAAIIAGLLADYIGSLRMTLICFGLLFIGGGMIATGMTEGAVLWPFFVSMVTAALGLYALRGLYFAITEKANVPLAYTGTAIGIVSVLGYTPDVFWSPLMGKLLDASPGALGHRQVFMVVCGFAALGFLMTLVFKFLDKKSNKTQPVPPLAELKNDSVTQE